MTEFKVGTIGGGYARARMSVGRDRVYLAVEDDGRFADSYLTPERARDLAGLLLVAAEDAAENR